MAKRALILGASGLIGGQLLPLLLQREDYHRVIVISRRALPVTHARLDNPVTDFAALAEIMEQHPAEDIYCCLGTTRKQAGSRRRFEQVDFDYPLLAARTGRHLAAQHFLLVSSIGANTASPSFYLRTKGKVERAISALNYPHLSIFRPSLLSGRRQQTRIGETIAEKCLAALGPLAGPHRPIAAGTVARAMAAATQQPQQARAIYLPRQIRRLARQFVTDIH